MRTEWIVVAVVALIALYAVIVFNRLIRGRNLVREGFCGIDVQLKRRQRPRSEPRRDRESLRRP